MSWEYKTTEAVMKVLLRKRSITREVASMIDDLLRRESNEVPAEVSVLFKKFHSVFDKISEAIEQEAENRPARKEDETDEDEIEGVTFVGGEPFDQAGALALLAENIRMKKLGIVRS